MLWKLLVLITIWTIGGLIGVVTYITVRAKRFAKAHGTADMHDKLIDDYLSSYSDYKYNITEEDGVKEAIEKVSRAFGGLVPWIAELLRESILWPMTLAVVKSMCDEYEASYEEV